MPDIISCPNCGAAMNQGDPCPECDHDDGDDDCRCQHCEAGRELYEDNFGPQENQDA